MLLAKKLIFRLNVANNQQQTFYLSKPSAMMLIQNVQFSSPPAVALKIPQRFLSISSWNRSSSSPSFKHKTISNDMDAKSESNKSTVSPGEVEKFEKIASSWWDPKGPLKELHSMNKLRVPLIRDGLLQSKQRVLDFDISESPNPLENFQILDVGCGGGILTEPLGRLGATVIGIDPGKENISLADSHLSDSLRAKISYECTTIEEYAQKNLGKLFNGIIMSEIIEHVEKPETVIEVAAKLTKIGGSVFITTLNRSFESWAGAIVAWEYLLRKLPIGTHSWNKFLTPQELQTMLTKHGFRVKLVHGMSYNPVTHHWTWSKSTSINYCIHAIRES